MQVARYPRMSDASLAGIRVLVVEDDEDALEMLSTVLERSGASVTRAASVPDAFASFCRARPDVVLSDVRMPIESGYDLVRRIRALSEDEGGAIAIIAVSAERDLEGRAGPPVNAFTAFVRKPVEIDALLRVVALHVS
jgi:CheY-like chemotaxis protein